MLMSIHLLKMYSLARDSVKILVEIPAGTNIATRLVEAILQRFIYKTFCMNGPSC